MEEKTNQRLSLPLDAGTTAPYPAPPAVPPKAGLEERVLAALQSCYDPEIPVNIYELGLIYDLRIDSAGAVHIKMTLTSPACPVAGALPAEVQAKVKAVPGVIDAQVDLVWDPPWDKSRMSEAALLQLGFFD
jgi:FeS assembly SUF system protein